MLTRDLVAVLFAFGLYLVLVGGLLWAADAELRREERPVKGSSRHGRETLAARLRRAWLAARVRWRLHLLGRVR